MRNTLVMNRIIKNLFAPAMVCYPPHGSIVLNLL
ncbi:hypothetical protein PANA5342_2461 [Pantoea ananatis LMG 5342]|nr:hypothetical protein PANA5342_2461 [Pantoea ananatis LMG 5342]